MTRLAVLALLAVAVFALTGNSKTMSVPPAVDHSPCVAVVDLDRVAASIGFTKAYQERMKARQEALMTEFRGKTEKLQKLYEDMRKRYGEKPTPEQQQELQQLSAKCNDMLRSDDQKGGQILQTEGNNYINKYRDRVRPIAKRIAEDRGASIVLTLGAQTFDYSASIDITDQVTNDVKALMEAGAFPLMEPLPAALPTTMPRGLDSKP